MCTTESETSDGVDTIPGYGNFKSSFINRYETEFGFVLPNRNIIIDDIRVRGIGKTMISNESAIEKSISPPQIEQVRY